MTIFIDESKTKSNKFLEMNVDGNASMSSGKSSTKRRAPTAPHVWQYDKKHHLCHSNNPVSL